MKHRLFKIVSLLDSPLKRKKEKTEERSLFDAPCHEQQMALPKDHAEYGEDSVFSGNGIGAVFDGVGGCASEYTAIFADMLTFIISEVDDFISQDPTFLDDKKRSLLSHDSLETHSIVAIPNAVLIFYAMLCHFGDIYNDVKNEDDSSREDLQDLPSHALMNTLVTSKKNDELPTAAATASFAKLRQTATGEFYLDTMALGDSPIYVFSASGELKSSNFGHVHSSQGSLRLNPAPLQLNFQNIASLFEKVWIKGSLDIELNTMDVFETILQEALFYTVDNTQQSSHYTYAEVLEHGAKTFFQEIPVNTGDVVVVASDGVKDNLSNDSLTRLYKLAQQEHLKQTELTLAEFFSELIFYTIFLLGDDESNAFEGVPYFNHVTTKKCNDEIVKIINLDRIPFTKERLAVLDQALAEEPNLGIPDFNYAAYTLHLENFTIKLDDTSVAIFEVPKQKTYKKRYSSTF